MSKSKGSRDHWRGPWSWELEGIGHIKSRNERRKQERRRQRRKEKQELTRSLERELS